MNAIFRMSGAHAGDIGAVAAYLKQQASAPVWLIGTSMGTFSAAEGAIAAKGVDGLVLSSTITRAKPEWKIAGSHPDGVASMALQRVTVPALIVSHKRDGCDVTPAADAPKLSKRLTKARKVDVVLLDGGAPPRSDPCEAMSQHGFLGIEAEAVNAIGEVREGEQQVRLCGPPLTVRFIPPAPLCEAPRENGNDPPGRRRPCPSRHGHWTDRVAGSACGPAPLSLRRSARAFPARPS